MNAPIPNQEPTLADVMKLLTELSGKVEAQQQQIEQALAPEPTQEQYIDALAELDKKSDAELAAEGYTREQIDQAIEQALAGAEQQADPEGEAQSEDEGSAQDGEGSEQAAPAAPAAAGAALERLEKSMIALEAKFKGAEEAATFETVKTEFDAIETAFDALTAENEALRITLETKGGKAVNNGTVRDAIGFEVGNEGHTPGSFENLVELEVKAGKKKSTALLEVARKNPDAHYEYLRRQGISK